jgi:hypothetical protein
MAATAMCLPDTGTAPTSTGLDPRKLATHSMRRTKVTLIYRSTANLRGA